MSYRDICWVVEGPGTGDNLPSARYMCAIPAQTLGGRYVIYPPEEDPDRFLDRLGPRMLIINKPITGAVVRVAERARARAIPLAVALSDWRFDRPHVRAISAMADRVIVQTEAMAGAVASELGLASTVIEECYEGPRVAPRLAPLRQIRLVWYGHEQNIDTLDSALRQIATVSGRDFALRIVTNAQPRQVDEILRRMPPPHSSLALRYLHWTLERQFHALSWSDLVLLPSSHQKDKAVKGHNRLVQAIHGGRLSLAFPLPPYREMQEFCWLGEDMAQGIEWALSHREEALARLRAGQAYVDRRFSPAALAPKWRALIAELAGIG